MKSQPLFVNLNNLCELMWFELLKFFENFHALIQHIAQFR